MAKSESDKQGADSPSRLIDQRIEELGDWRGEMLAPDTNSDQRSGSGCGGGMEVARCSRVVPRRNDLYR